MLSRRVNFIEAEVARLDLDERKIIVAHGELEGAIPYDYLIFALGRRLATERVPGFFEHAHHLLDVEGALKLGDALRAFRGGQVVIGQCPGARLPVPVYETAFALSESLKKKAELHDTKITVVGPGTMVSEFGDHKVPLILGAALERNGIEHVPNFPICCVGPRSVFTNDGRALDYNLLILLPPFSGASAASRLGITNDGYLNVDWNMKVIGVDRMYAVGDCVNFDGPKMGHMAVRQAEVAAASLVSELAGNEPVTHYNHETTMVIDAARAGGIYFHKDLWSAEPGSVGQGRFWDWAKRVHEKYWEVTHA
jgi:sulfide:quinone oxidoreductase